MNLNRVAPVARALTVSEPISTDVSPRLMWTEAVARAKRTLIAERSAGISLSTKYAGSPLAAFVLRAKGGRRIAQYILAVATISLVGGYSRVLGFGPVSQAFFTMSMLNIALKAVVFGLQDPLGRDDAPVYMILRALPPDSLDRALCLPMPWALPSLKNWFGIRGWCARRGSNSWLPRVPPVPRRAPRLAAL